MPSPKWISWAGQIPGRGTKLDNHLKRKRSCSSTFGQRIAKVCCGRYVGLSLIVIFVDIRDSIKMKRSFNYQYGFAFKTEIKLFHLVIFLKVGYQWKALSSIILALLKTKDWFSFQWSLLKVAVQWKWKGISTVILALLSKQKSGYPLDNDTVVILLRFRKHHCSNTFWILNSIKIAYRIYVVILNRWTYQI